MKNQIKGGIAITDRLAPRQILLTIIASPLVLFFLAMLLTGRPITPENPPPIKPAGTISIENQVREVLKKNSRKLQLVENNGQLGLPGDVAAYFTSANETVFIEKDRLRIIVTEKAGEQDSGPRDAANGRAGLLHGQRQYRYNAFSIRFSGSGGFTELQKINPFTVKRNFIHASTSPGHFIGATSYEEIILKNVYEGIDLRLYSQEDGLLEFDWIVWPGADVNLIRLEFEGNKDLRLSSRGDLQVVLGMGVFHMRLPESYYVTPQGKKPVNARFSLDGMNAVRFTGLGSNNKKYPLVIDPDLLWGTFFDGADNDFDEYLYGIEYNYSNSLIYCAGAASLQVSTSYAAALSSAYDSTFAATPDALVYALTKDGQFVQHITYLGGLGGDVAIGISLSTSFVYVSGHTTSTDFPVTLSAASKHPAFDSVYHGGTDGFVAVFNLNLDSLHYCTYLGGDGTDKALTIRAVTDSLFYVSLSATDTLPESSPDYIQNYADSIFAGNSEAWIGKFSSFNLLSFGTYIGGNNNDLVNDFQVMSNGDIVLAGHTRNITEVNASIPDNGSGQEALFGKIQVPASGPVSFDIIDKIGGSDNDYGWGIYNIGDSVSILTGQTTSADFPLGAGSVFQNTAGGQIDGFIARIYNDGSAGYKATFTGGSDDDILVSVRPVVVNNVVALLSWGTTSSTDLVTRNFNAGSFFSANKNGDLDMMFVICDMDLVTKYYLSYVGGSVNDYLGITGAPAGSNHLFYNIADSVLYLGTTTHSSQNTHVPRFVGRGIADIINATVPVFDSTKGNGYNDTHVIIAISAKSLFELLAVKWVQFKSQLLQDCSIRLFWELDNNESISAYTVERSPDGLTFEAVGIVSSGSATGFFNDREAAGMTGMVYYRVAAREVNGKTYYSPVQAVNLCKNNRLPVTIYPTFVKNSFTVSGLDPQHSKNIVVSLLDVSGKLIYSRQIKATMGPQTLYLDNTLVPGTYFIIVRDAEKGNTIAARKILAGQ